MYYKLEQMAFFFVVPVVRWLLAVFLVLNFLAPLLTAWAGDMLGMFFQQAHDELRGFILKFLPEWMQ